MRRYQRHQDALLVSALWSQKTSTDLVNRLSSDLRGIERGRYDNLLPLLEARIKLMPTNDGTLRSRILARSLWVQAVFEKRFSEVATVISALERDGIQCVLLKGAAFNLVYASKYGARWMRDIDLLVRESEVRKVFERLLTKGWTPIYEHFGKIQTTSLDMYIPYRHAIPFRHPTKNITIDLHWHALRACVKRESDEYFWKQTINVESGQKSYRVLTPTAHLLHTIIHGLEWKAETDFRWIVDSLILLEANAGQIEWDEFTRELHIQKLALFGFAALRFLNDEYEACIPPYVLQTLSNQSTLLDHFELELKNSCANTQLLGNWPFVLFQARRSNIYTIVKYFKYTREVIRYTWGIDRLLGLPSLFVRKWLFCRSQALNQNE